MAFVYRRGSSWTIGYVDERGAQVRMASKASTKNEAKQEAQELEQRAHRIAQGLEVAPPRRMLFREFCDRYLTEIAARRRSAEAITSRVNRHLRPHFGHLPLATIRTEEIEGFLSAKLQERSGLDGPLRYAPQTVEHLRVTLRAMFNVAIRWQLARVNPAAQTEAISVPEPRPRFLELAQVRSLVAVIPDEWRPMLLVAICLGIRKGELIGLRTRNVDLTAHTLFVEHSYDGPTKTKKPRAVPIPAELVHVLAAQLAIAGPEYLFPNPKTGKRFTKDLKLHERMDGWCKLAGVPRAVWKDLRSTFATHSSKQVGLRFTQKALGHSRLDTTATHYDAHEVSHMVDGVKALNFGTHDPLTTAAAEAGFSPVPPRARDTGFEPVAFGSGGQRSGALQCASERSIEQIEPLSLLDARLIDLEESKRTHNQLTRLLWSELLSASGANPGAVIAPTVLH